jgi:hypothetical protein
VTGAEHYREAERLLAAANRKLAPENREYANGREARAELRAEAQIHATLSLAAATALAPGAKGWSDADRTAWEAAAAETPARR